MAQVLLSYLMDTTPGCGSQPIGQFAIANGRICLIQFGLLFRPTNIDG